MNEKKNEIETITDEAGLKTKIFDVVEKIVKSINEAILAQAQITDLTKEAFFSFKFSAGLFDFLETEFRLDLYLKIGFHQTGLNLFKLKQGQGNNAKLQGLIKARLTKTPSDGGLFDIIGYILTLLPVGTNIYFKFSASVNLEAEFGESVGFGIGTGFNLEGTLIKTKYV